MARNSMHELGNQFKDILRAKPGRQYEDEIKSEAEKETIAMDTYRRNISSYRASVAPHNQRAPGWDYVNWKPYGTRRPRKHEYEYTHFCRALAPYIKDVAASAAQGMEERRWEGLAGAAPPPLSKSRFGSRDILGSRDRLLNQ